jgi:GH25 family lysozyme M1 (1,4-beta-N-acetylmuramidase)
VSVRNPASFAIAASIVLGGGAPARAGEPGDAEMGDGLALVEPGAGQPIPAVTCADGETLWGMDVSKWQGDIDWNAVKGDGIVYAFIRVSHGVNTLDEYFESNWQAAHDVGVYAGVYQYFEPGQDPIVQADILLERMGPLGPTDLPPVIDVESHGGLPPAEVASAIGQWIAHVEGALGVQPIIYTGRYFWQDYVQTAEFADYPLWIAHYTDGCPNIPDVWQNWVFHQYSSTGSVAGIAGDVDMNDFNGGLAELMGLFAVPPLCGDGMCTGAEDADACPADCPPCGVVDPLGGTIDDGDACYGWFGPPEYWRTEAVGEGGSLRWTAVTDFAEPSNFAIVSLHFAEAGRYRVEANLVPEFAKSTQAVYEVVHGGATELVPVDQSASAGWISLGDFDFAQGGGQRVRLDDNTGEPNALSIPLCFDAIRVTRLDPPEGGDSSSSGDGEPEPDPDPEGTSGESGSDEGVTDALPGTGGAQDDAGCGCRGRGAAPAGLILPAWGAAAAVRRRRARR